MRTRIVVSLLAAAAVALAGPILAAPVTRDGGESAALAKAQYMIKEMSNERDAALAEVARLKEEVAGRDRKIESLNKQIERTSKNLTSSEDSSRRYMEAVATQRERMGEMREKFEALVAKYRELVAGLRHVEQERAFLQNHNRDQLRTLEECSTRNAGLMQANFDLLEQYKNKGVMDALLQREPVTQLKRVEIENMVQEMEMRIERLKASDPAVIATTQ